ncbi:MAG: hypothetical protein M5U25_03015 [Planctomycetota bacterium]|nr:hypothetical protein [Planctomycetota bacterium]
MLLALAPAVVADRVRPVPVKDDSKEAFSEFERLLPLVTSGDEKDAAEVRKALGDKSHWIVIAAVEAVRQGEVDKPGAGKVFLPDVIALMGKDSEKLHKEEIVTVNVIACLGALAGRDDPEALTVAQALVDWQRWSKNQVVRLRHMAERVLFKLSGEDCTLTDDTITFWEWWVRNKGVAQAEKAPEKKEQDRADRVQRADRRHAPGVRDRHFRQHEARDQRRRPGEDQEAHQSPRLEENAGSPQSARPRQGRAEVLDR